jgi:hypothetical protein
MFGTGAIKAKVGLRRVEVRTMPLRDMVFLSTYSLPLFVAPTSVG